MHYNNSRWIQQVVALTRRNTTGPSWSVGRPTARAPGGRPARRQCCRRRQTTYEDRRQLAKQYWPIGGPVTNVVAYTVSDYISTSNVYEFTLRPFTVRNGHRNVPSTAVNRDRTCANAGVGLKNLILKAFYGRRQRAQC